MQVRNISRKVALIAAPALLIAGQARAALDPAIDTMFTTMSADATSGLAKGWPFFALVTGGFVVYKIIKKVVGKAV